MNNILIFATTDSETSVISAFIQNLPTTFEQNVNFHYLILKDLPEHLPASTLMPKSVTQNRNDITILSSPIRMGQGGNQKIGYRYAIEKGFDLVIYLPRIETYSENTLKDIIRIWEDRKPDVIRPSRSTRRTLDSIEYKISGIEASSSHQKPCAFSVQFLSRIPFELNSDEEHFDVEIVLQACALGSAIAEFTYAQDAKAGMEPSLKAAYFWNSVKACLKYRFQRIGFFCTMQYRGLLSHDTRYSDKSSYWGSSHQRVISRLRLPARVLDLGCGPGFVSKKLKEEGCYVVGMDSMPVENYPGDKFYQVDLEKERPPTALSSFDYVLLLDVLEHLSDPERFLIQCRYSAGSEKPPTFMISTGNVAFIGVRVSLGIGFFTYGERGILDVTHKRLFTLHSFRRMLRDTGYEIRRVEGVGVPFQLVFSGFIGRCLSQCSSFLAKLRPSLFAFQIIIEASPKPHSLMLLSQLEEQGK